MAVASAGKKSVSHTGTFSASPRPPVLIHPLHLFPHVGIGEDLLGRAAPRSRPSSSSIVMRTSRGFDPLEGPTIPRCSRRSMRRPARAKPTCSLRWSIEVEPS